jgi:hypothetical protein
MPKVTSHGLEREVLTGWNMLHAFFLVMGGNYNV